MKSKLAYTAGILFLSLLLFDSIEAINSAKGSSQVFNPGKQLLITAMHTGFNPLDTCLEEFSPSGYALMKDTLHFNAWHRYGKWFCYDDVFGDLNVVSQGITNTLFQNDQRNLRTIFDRPISRYVCYGQRSDYQCEQIDFGDDYYFHSYESSVTNSYVSDITDNTIFGNGAKVKFCSFNGGSPGAWSGYIVRDLISNREQCNRVIDHTRDDKFDWYVKPSIRIDTAFANNPSNQDVKVCRIDLIDWNGDTVKKVEGITNF